MELSTIIMIAVAFLILFWILKIIKKGIILFLIIAAIFAGYSWLTNDSSGSQLENAPELASFGQGAWEVISGPVELLQELDVELSFASKYLEFNHTNGFQGKIGKGEDDVFLQTSSPADNKESVKNVIKLAHLFSDSENMKNKVEDIIKNNVDDKISLGENSYVQLLDGILTVYVTKSL
jgi:hypothetical protein